MPINVMMKNGISVVVPVVARLDASHAENLRKSLKEALDSGSGNLVLDLESVNLVDSTILGVVVGAFRNLPADRHLVLCAVSENVANLLHLTHLDRILNMYGSCEEALAILAP